jgi:hypothetical protein
VPFADREHDRRSSRSGYGLGALCPHDLRFPCAILPLRTVARLAHAGGAVVRHRRNLENTDHRLYDHVHRANQHDGWGRPYRAQQVIITRSGCLGS